MLGLGLGLQYGGVLFAYDSQAVAHFNRVIADGGTIPAGLAGCDAWFKAVKGVYGVSDITSAISSGIHPHYLGYKAGAGSGATLGSAAQTCYNAIGSTGDVIQTTAASQPLILPHTGTNYTWLPGVNGNYFSTPNVAANSQTTEIVITANLSNLRTYAAGGESICGKWLSLGAPSNSNYLFYTTTNTLNFICSNGSTTRSFAATSTIPSSGNLWVRTWYRSNVSGNSTVIFYTSTDNITYTQLGSVITIAGSFVLNSFSRPLEIGSWNSGGSGNFTGPINRLYIQNTIDGTIVQDFNPASYSRATSGTTWTSTTGEVWTLNTPSTNNALKAAIVDTTYLMGNGTSIGMRAASLSFNQTGITGYTAFRKFVNTSGLQAIREISDDYVTGPGALLYINSTANQEGFGIRANVGRNVSEFASTSLSLKLATYINDINNANESNPYLINNVSQTFVSQTFTNNNTSAMICTGYNLLARNNAASAWANVMMACDIVSKNADSTGTQTAMYTALKPFLVNAI